MTILTLQEIIANNDISSVKYFIKNNPNINLNTPFDGEGNTYLMEAAYLNDPGITKLLLKNGADAMVCNIDGDMAIDVAKDCGHKRVAKALSIK